MNRSGMTKQIKDAPASRSTTNKRNMKMGGIVNMKKGGKVPGCHCRGGGAATRGTRFGGKD